MQEVNKVVRETILNVMRKHQDMPVDEALEAIVMLITSCIHEITDEEARCSLAKAVCLDLTEKVVAQANILKAARLSTITTPSTHLH